MTTRTHEQLMDQNAYDNLWKDNAALRKQLAARDERIRVLEEAVKRISTDTVLDRQEASYYKRIMSVWVEWAQQALKEAKS